jgi:predicted GNAT superfamily acetyltransferase
MELTIRPLKALGEMRAAVDLQKTYWGDNLESVIPAHMLFSLASHGGHVLTAFDGDRMAGVLIGFLGTSEQNSTRPAMANLQIVSKRMVVLPEYRNQGLGYRLKLAQRDLAVTQGIRLITWTFDPLLAPNAHLNVRKLGVTCPVFLQDYYGVEDEGGLVTLGSSDRLLAEWWVTNRRVEERIYGNRNDLSLEQYLGAGTAILNPTTVTSDGMLLPAESDVIPTTSLALVEIPIDYQRMVRDNPTLAQRWRMHIRSLFQRQLGAGFVVTDFLRTTSTGRQRAFYVLSYDGSGPFSQQTNGARDH